MAATCRSRSAIVAATTFLVLFLMTGSVLLPVKAVLMNLLTLAPRSGCWCWSSRTGGSRGCSANDRGRST